MSFDTTFWGWPQYVLIGLFILTLIIALGRNGKPVVDQTYSVAVTMGRLAIILILLIAGGFFK